MNHQYKICTVIAKKDFQAVKDLVDKTEKDTDLFELRADYLENINKDLIKKLKSLFTLPVIFTLRTEDQGGNFSQSETDRLELFQTAIDVGFDFIDLEFDSKLKEKLKKKSSRLIVSYHNFEKTPSYLELKKMIEEVDEQDIFKIATKVITQENFRVLTKILIEKKDAQDLIVVGMGNLGRASRIFFPFLGSFLTYVSLNNKIAPGQFSLEEIKSIFSKLEIENEEKKF